MEVRLSQKEYSRNPKTCSNPSCSKQILWNQRANKYCSSSCAARVNNQGVRRHGKAAGNCLHCGSKLFKSINTFCSGECSSEYVRKQYEQEVESQGGFGNIVSYTAAKKYLIRKRGHLCEICKNTEWLGKPIPLVFDHVDGRSNNNKLTNVRLVCGNCDMQLPTYKSKNKNSDRKERYLAQRKIMPL